MHERVGQVLGVERELLGGKLSREHVGEVFQDHAPHVVDDNQGQGRAPGFDIGAAIGSHPVRLDIGWRQRIIIIARLHQPFTGLRTAHNAELIRRHPEYRINIRRIEDVTDTVVIGHRAVDVGGREINAAVGENAVRFRAIDPIVDCAGQPDASFMVDARGRIAGGVAIEPEPPNSYRRGVKQLVAEDLELSRRCRRRSTPARRIAPVRHRQDW